MHHLKETTIDGVKFVLIPEELHDKLASYVAKAVPEGEMTVAIDQQAVEIVIMWSRYDPEIFNGF